jgi:hypothetical protein
MISFGRIGEKEKVMYQTMWKMFQTGQITERKWLVFCDWYMWNCIMVRPEIVEMMVRMKYN